MIYAFETAHNSKHQLAIEATNGRITILGFIVVVGRDKFRMGNKPLLTHYVFLIQQTLSRWMFYTLISHYINGNRIFATNDDGTRKIHGVVESCCFDCVAIDNGLTPTIELIIAPTMNNSE